MWTQIGRVTKLRLGRGALPLPAPVSCPSRQPQGQGRAQEDAPDSSSMDTRKCQWSNEKTREQSNKTPFNVPPTPQRAPGRSGCPSETSIEVPERLRTSLPLDLRPQAAAARLSPRCSSSCPLETANSARRKRLREEHDDRSCLQTREPPGQMDPLLKIPGAGALGARRAVRAAVRCRVWEAARLSSQ